MVSQNLIRDAITQGQSLEEVAAIYTEISIQKLQRIRGQIETNRQFATDLSGVFHIIREAALVQKIILPKKKKTNLAILLTSNHPFYGGIEAQLARFFMAHSALTFSDLVVVGRTGRDYLRDFNFRSPFQSFTFHDDLPDLRELSDMVSLLVDYERVLVYHSKFQSIVIQRPVVEEIMGLVSSTPVTNPNFYYILEPETIKMLEFFNGQIAKLLLEQTFLEAELARTGARLILMDDSARRAETFIKEEKRLLGLAEKSERNSKMLEMALATLTRRKIDDR